MSFASDVEGYVDATNKWMDDIVQGTFVGLGAKVIKATPVLTGRLRNNWVSSVGQPSRADDRAGQKAGADAVADELDTAGKYSPGDTLWLSNNLEYARAVEDGTATRPPVGMLKLTVAEYQRIFSKAADEAAW
jgi:hypothetical protein